MLLSNKNHHHRCNNYYYCRSSILLLLLCGWFLAVSVHAFSVTTCTLSHPQSRLCAVSEKNKPSETTTTSSSSSSILQHYHHNYLAGNIGFDPLGLSKTREQLFRYREMENKHGRLAMLAATVILSTQLYDQFMAQSTGLELEMVEYYDHVWWTETFFSKVSPTFFGTCLGLLAAVELYGTEQQATSRTNHDYFAGNLGFDPLQLYPIQKQQQRQRQTAEIVNGRMAMMGMAVYLWQQVGGGGESDFMEFVWRLWDLQTTT